MASSPIMIDDTITSRRKAKRLIPDSEKDERYWAKRHKNNAAAKRSRENKRQMDDVMRTKLSNLEEENLLLRRELSLLKRQFNIPEDQSFLSRQERDKIAELESEKQYLKEISKYDQNNYLCILSKIKQEPACEPDNHEVDTNTLIETNPLMLLSRLSTRDTAGYEYLEEMREPFNDDRLFRYSHKDLGTPPTAHSPTDSHTKHDDAVASDDDMQPADLSISKQNQRHNHDGLRDSSRSAHDRKFGSENDSTAVSEKSEYAVNSSESREIDPEQFGCELKEKLQKLSDQVMKMQKMVNL